MDEIEKKRENEIIKKAGLTDQIAPEFLTTIKELHADPVEK